MIERPVVIGSAGDAHVRAVVEAAELRGGKPQLLDAERLATSQWELRGPHLTCVLDGHPTTGRAWIRRLAPPASHQGLAIGSREAAEASSRLSFLAALSSSPIDWLTDYWTLMRAENKLVQYATAVGIGLAVPHFEVVSHPSLISTGVGNRFIAKPLGLGEYRSSAATFAVHSNLVDRDDPRIAGLGEAPFLLQAFVEAKRHLRVVTVGASAWSAGLDATGRPVDWRTEPSAHAAWRPSSEPGVEDQALALASALGLGYSSQDWIVDVSDRAWFVDGNPAGQWLFLPREVADPVSAAIAAWLVP